MSGLRFTGLRKSFATEAGPRVEALKGVSGMLAPGRITGLVGPDAAGKTTLIRVLASLMTPDEGDVTTQSTRISYMPQKFGLYEDLTVEENLNLYADLHGLDATARVTTFERLHAFTNLGPFTKRLAGNLSGGMKQKLGLACTLVVVPEILLLDEPSVGVDPLSRRDLWQMVQSLIGTGIAVLWSTAYLDEAARCDDVILLHDGSMLYQGPPADLIGRVAGRTWKMALSTAGTTARKRDLQRAAMALPGVTDGQIQGRSLRLMTNDAQSPPTAMSGPLLGLTAIATTPQFEDAYLAMLPQRHLAAPSPVKPHAAENAESAAGAAIETHNLTRRFDSFTAVDRISFSVARGEIFGLLGPNGAGKSTTFKMLCGLLVPTSGEARVAGFNLRTARAVARGRIGYMAQKFAHLGHLSVSQNMEFAAQVYGLSNREMVVRIAETVESYGLTGYRNESCDRLPLGIRQRMALACAVIHRPAILFLDEPTSGVDPVTRREFWDRINEMADSGMTVLVTSHFIDEAEYCDRLGIIYRGKMIALGLPEDIRTAHDPEGGSLEQAFIALVEAYDRDNPQ
ncbi:MAG: ABC transporter ATP-binding protein [Rhodospirillaceae bacterium]|nr:MAG: ABC transporter ATP-binding protein [Rhodospirillaceae bacterium]